MIFEGQEGLYYFYQRLVEIAKSKDEVLVIASSKTVLDVFNFYFLNLSKRINKVNVRGRMIANRKILKSIVLKKIMSLTKLELKLLPRGYVSPVAVFIFKNSIGFCNFLDNPFVILVDDAELSGSYKSHFEELWKKAEK